MGRRGNCMIGLMCTQRYVLYIYAYV
jgi:hypothetical protein